jgi:hypothetical protein
MRIGDLAGIIGIVSASGSLGGGQPPAGEVVIQEGSWAQVNGCIVELAHTCDGPEGRLAAIDEDCGENPSMLGMGPLEDDCVALGDAVYCIDRVAVGPSVSLIKRYDTADTRLQSGDVLRAARR